MAACLRSRFLAMSRSSAPSSPSTSLNASAMARCSCDGGIGIGRLRRASLERFFILPLVPVAKSLILAFCGSLLKR